MPNTIFNKETMDVIRYVSNQLCRLRGNDRYPYDYSFGFLEIYNKQWHSGVRNHLRYLDEQLKEFDLITNQKIFSGESFEDWRWLFLEKEIEIIPIYNEAVALVESSVIISPDEIPNLIQFLAFQTKIIIENHGNGYHFHYGEVKKNKFNRYDVLFTFNKNNADINGNPIADIPLYSEPHAAGKCLHVDISTVGHNKRRPIYQECIVQLKKKKLNDFMHPSKDSSKFYPMA